MHAWQRSRVLVAPFRRWRPFDTRGYCKKVRLPWFGLRLWPEATESGVARCRLLELSGGANLCLASAAYVPLMVNQIPTVRGRGMEQIVGPFSECSEAPLASSCAVTTYYWVRNLVEICKLLGCCTLTMSCPCSTYAALCRDLRYCRTALLNIPNLRILPPTTIITTNLS